MNRYMIDTCSFIWAFRKAYPIDVLPVFWEKFDEAVKNGFIFSSRMVLWEIEKQDDALLKWTKDKKKLFLSIDQSVIDAADCIIKAYPNMLNAHKEKDGADPFLIAHAQILGAVVVTQETKNGVKHPKMKVPDVCDKLGIRTVDMLTMVKELGWTFR